MTPYLPSETLRDAFAESGAKLLLVQKRDWTFLEDFRMEFQPKTPFLEAGVGFFHRLGTDPGVRLEI